MEYHQNRSFRKVIDLDIFNKSVTLLALAHGEGTYPELHKEGKIRWSALKTSDNSWVIKWQPIKKSLADVESGDQELIMPNDSNIISELIDCTQEVFELYKNTKYSYER